MSVLVPIDPTAPSRSAVQLAALVARNLGRDVLLLHVSQRQSTLDSLARLHELGRSIRESGIPVRLRSIQGDVAEGILAVAAERRCSWIFMGTRLAEGADAGPSVARSVLSLATQPAVAVAQADDLLDDRLPIGLVGSVGPAAARLVEELARARRCSWFDVAPPDAVGRLRSQAQHGGGPLGAVVTTPDRIWGDGAVVQPAWRAFLSGPDASPLLVVSEAASAGAVR